MSEQCERKSEHANEWLSTIRVDSIAIYPLWDPVYAELYCPLSALGTKNWCLQTLTYSAEKKPTKLALGTRSERYATTR